VPERRSSRLRLREAIRTAGLDCGFDQVGFAPAEAPLHAGAFLDWIEAGHHGEMGYMARDDAVRRRLDPSEALPGCRTIVVVSLLYGSGEAADPGVVAQPGLAAGPGLGATARVARYVGGRDYHGVFEDRLDALADAISALAPEASTRRYVDYGPVLERDHAQRAGLGWIGKNTMLIHPRLGSYLMLGELLTDLDLEPDEPFLADRCGSCRRCIDACPTDAILGGRTIDARRCISYLTIEFRGSIPLALRRAIGNRVFGCDICQEVCPWNTDAPDPESHPFASVCGRPVPSQDMIAWAESLIALGEDGFRAAYRGSALARPGRDGLLRNLAVGLGNSGATEALPTLERLARDESEVVSEHARWAIEQVR